MNEYQPNFSNQRVRDRCIKSLDWTITNLSGYPLRKSKKEIRDQFGNSERPLGKWLRQQLLIESDPYYNKELGICKKWTANQEGIKHLEQLLNITPEIDLTVKYKQEFETGEFPYNDKSNRLWHPLQFVPTRIRKPSFARQGFSYHYDIKAAAPTLIKQYAVKLGLTKPTPSLDQFLSDRTKFRDGLSQRIGIDTKTSKRIISALLQGARIQSYWNNSIFRLLNKDQVKLNLLSNDQELKSLREDFKKCWDVIKPTLKSESLITTKGIRSKSITAKVKSDVYRKLEEEVMIQVRTYLRRTKNRSFDEHDGWCCKGVVDINELVTYVRNTTGYQIEFDWEIWEYVSSTI